MADCEHSGGVTKLGISDAFEQRFGPVRPFNKGGRSQSDQDSQQSKKQKSGERCWVMTHCYQEPANNRYKNYKGTPRTCLCVVIRVME